MAEPVTLTPIDGWGFYESIDGELATPFRAEVQQKAVRFGPDVVGWSAKALDGKYAGAQIKVTPRNMPFVGVLVLEVTDPETGKTLYSGFADSQGLDPDWRKVA